MSQRPVSRMCTPMSISAPPPLCALWSGKRWPSGDSAAPHVTGAGKVDLAQIAGIDELLHGLRLPDEAGLKVHRQDALGPAWDAATIARAAGQVHGHRLLGHDVAAGLQCGNRHRRVRSPDACTRSRRRSHRRSSRCFVAVEHVRNVELRRQLLRRARSRYRQWPRCGSGPACSGSPECAHPGRSRPPPRSRCQSHPPYRALLTNDRADSSRRRSFAVETPVRPGEAKGDRANPIRAQLP